MFFQIGGISDPVDHGKKPRSSQGCEHPVPCSPVKVNALPRRRQKSQRPRMDGFRHDDKEWVLGHRQESLAPLRMSFQQVEGVGETARFGVEKADASASVPSEIQFGTVVKAPAFARVDNLVGCPYGVEHIAEGDEGPCRERLAADIAVSTHSLGCLLTSL